MNTSRRHLLASQYCPENFIFSNRWYACWMLCLAGASVFLEINFGESAGHIRDLFLISCVPALLLAPKSIFRSWAIIFLLISCGVALVSWGASHFLHPELAERSPKVNRLSNWLWAIPFALSFGGNLKSVYCVWGLALLGLLLSPWLSGGGLAEISRGLNGIRIDFSLHNAQHTALFFGVALLGLLAFMPRILSGKLHKLVAFGGWLLAVGFVTVAILITQTRGVWLALLAGFLVLGAMIAMDLLRRRQPNHFIKWLLMASVVIGGVLVSQGHVIADRFNEEAEIFTRVVDGKPLEGELTSSGIRIHSWLAAKEWILERPIVGWGGQGRKHVIEQAEHIPQSIKDITRHLHSSYIDTLVNFGLLGLLLLFALWGWLLLIARRAYVAGIIPMELYTFFVAFMVFFAIANLFESYMFYTSGVLVFALISGAIISLGWRQEWILGATKRG